MFCRTRVLIGGTLYHQFPITPPPRPNPNGTLLQRAIASARSSMDRFNTKRCDKNATLHAAFPGGWHLARPGLSTFGSKLIFLVDVELLQIGMRTQALRDQINDMFGMQRYLCFTGAV